MIELVFVLIILHCWAQTYLFLQFLFNLSSISIFFLSLSPPSLPLFIFFNENKLQHKELRQRNSSTIFFPSSFSTFFPKLITTKKNRNQRSKPKFFSQADYKNFSNDLFFLLVAPWFGYSVRGWFYAFGAFACFSAVRGGAEDSSGWLMDWDWLISHNSNGVLLVHQL